MARINIILQGFVDINLETDENFNTKIGYKNNQTTTGSVNVDFNIQNLQGLRKSSTLPETIELPTSLEVIFEKINMNIESAQAVHLQGSRLYEVDGINSDWDLAVISTDVNSYMFKEVNIEGNEFDIHLYTQENFQNKLDNHEMRELEFLYHPSNVIFVNNKSFSVDISNNKLINRVKVESDYLWNKAKTDLGSGVVDDYLSLKRVWHSFRFLIFAEQILKDGSITDFTAANYLYESIVNSMQTDFEFFELNFGTLRETLKLNLDTFKDDGGLELVEFQL
jgi:hypothetical protein